MDILVGKITHYYNKIGVAVVDLSHSLTINDQVKISGHDQEFVQKVTSLQTEHQQIKKAKKGDSVGLKTDRPVKENDLVYLITP